MELIISTEDLRTAPILGVRLSFGLNNLRNLSKVRNIRSLDVPIGGIGR